MTVTPVGPRATALIIILAVLIGLALAILGRRASATKAWEDGLAASFARGVHQAIDERGP